MGLESIFKGWKGELKTKFINGLFLGEQYRIFNNVIIKTEHGSTQIDHVVVSPFGIFVIETKDKTGWIFGDPKQEQWTQIIYGKIFKFQNPLRQNYRHTKSLSEFFRIEHEKIHSLIVFWGDCEFKTPMPNNVFKGGFLGNNLKNFIQSKNTVLILPDAMNKICSDLIKLKDGTGFLSGWQHTSELWEKYNSTTKCPKCGGVLVQRISKSKECFLGCSNYPRCQYTKNI